GEQLVVGSYVRWETVRVQAFTPTCRARKEHRGPYRREAEHDVHASPANVPSSHLVTVPYSATARVTATVAHASPVSAFAIVMPVTLLWTHAATSGIPVPASFA